MEEVIELIIDILPLLIPLLVIQLGLLIAALIHIFRHDTYKVGSRAIWVIVCIFVNILGPILYFIIGRSEE
jgi:hypothetical protein